jgi:hypothetical protein
MFDFFNRHISISEVIWKLVKDLNKNKFLELMEKENAMELIKLVQEEIYRL